MTKNVFKIFCSEAGSFLISSAAQVGFFIPASDYEKYSKDHPSTCIHLLSGLEVVAVSWFLERGASFSNIPVDRAQLKVDSSEVFIRLKLPTKESMVWCSQDVTDCEVWLPRFSTDLFVAGQGLAFNRRQKELCAQIIGKLSQEEPNFTLIKLLVPPETLNELKANLSNPERWSNSSKEA